jgi:hypothetical protein
MRIDQPAASTEPRIASQIQASSAGCRVKARLVDQNI